jgi:uncharacterized repeat protein (TIGR03803 family)
MTRRRKPLHCRWQAAISVFVLLSATALGASAQSFKTLVSFNGVDGASPLGPLVQGVNGSAYGTTYSGGANGYGTVFKITRAGKLTTLYSFCPDPPGCGDGINPNGGLVLSSDGDFYGTTFNDGCWYQVGVGTVFKISPDGTLSTLWCFSGYDTEDGGGPDAGLVQAPNGNFYGSTDWGGLYGGGTMFGITAEGALTTLDSWSGLNDAPLAAMTLAVDGNLYGTTNLGGTGGGGTVFKVTPSGNLTTIYNFCSESNCTDGEQPSGTLVQAGDGNFYGTTDWGGTYGDGTVFQVTSKGELTTLHNFDGTDGQYVHAGLVLATDGNLYGTASRGGDYGYGTIFQMTPGGTFTTLHSFDNTDGSQPEGGLLQATNGNLYGATNQGGTNGSGTIFALLTGLSPFVSFVRAYGKVGQTGGILGQGFTGTTAVSLNGVPANFTVVSDTYIKATVPAEATTGYVTVTTPTGVLTSHVPFHVLK